MEPTIGRIVLYNTTEFDKVKMKAADTLNGGCNVRDQLPAIITAVISCTTVNLRVIADGEADLWVRSSTRGNNQGEWNWPSIK